MTFRLLNETSTETSSRLRRPTRSSWPNGRTVTLRRRGYPFVGNVVAYRTISGTLIEGNPRWTDEDPILSWVFQIEHAIEGIESETMFFEELYQESSCGAYFTFDRRFLYTGSWYSWPLNEEPTPEQLAHWRSLVEPNPAPNRPDNSTTEEDGCFTPPEEILAKLEPAGPSIPTRRAYIARVTDFRLNDTTLTDNITPCNDFASPQCGAFRTRIVSIVVDIETVIAGDPTALGHREFDFSAWEDFGCPLPRPGQLFLLGGSSARAEEPRVPLTDAPDQAQLTLWRNAGRVLGTFEMSDGAIETRLRLELNPSDTPARQLGPTLRILNEGTPIVLEGIILKRSADCETRLYPALLDDNPSDRRVYMAFIPHIAEFYNRDRSSRATDYEPLLGAAEPVVLQTGDTVDIVIQTIYGSTSICGNPFGEVVLRTSHGALQVTGPL